MPDEKYIITQKQLDNIMEQKFNEGIDAAINANLVTRKKLDDILFERFEKKMAAHNKKEIKSLLWNIIGACCFIYTLGSMIS